ncbi:MAG: bacterioferritin [Kangiellaceae bacterium]|jgi:bacterioferritin
MKAEKQVNAKLNQVLKLLLTGINQYFLHSRMCENWGFDQLKSSNYKYSIELMKESDDVIKRILFLEGLANLQDLGKLYIGEDVPESLAGNMRFESELRDSLVEAIEYCESVQDYISRDCLTKILDECEEQIDWIETQQFLIENSGLQNYLQSAM